MASPWAIIRQYRELEARLTTVEEGGPPGGGGGGGTVFTSLVAAEEQGLSWASGLGRFGTPDRVQFNLAEASLVAVFVNFDLWNPLSSFTVQLRIDGAVAMAWQASLSATPETNKLVRAANGDVAISKVAQEAMPREFGVPLTRILGAGDHTIEVVYDGGSDAATDSRGANRRLIAQVTPIA